MSGQIGFRPLTEAELPLLRRWLEQPHVARWWADPIEECLATRLAYIRGEKPTQPYLILLDGKPVGYIQTYRIADWPEHQANTGAEPGAFGMDLFIGEPDVVGRRIGRQVIAQFVSEIVFGQNQAASCYVDPEPQNLRAVRAYEAAGFRHIRTYRVPEEDLDAYLMQALPNPSV